MATEIDTVLETSFVLVNQGLLVDTASRKRFTDAYGAEVSTEPGIAVQVGGPSQVVEDSPNLVLPRDRISLELAPNRFAAKRQYPTEADLPRLAEVLALALLLSPHVRGRATFGFNITISYFHGANSTSSRYLADRLLPSGLSRRIAGGLNLDSSPPDVSGASLRFSYHHSGRRWSPRFEPRTSDLDQSGAKVYLALNVHHQNDFLPLGKDPICEFLTDVWHHAHDLVKAVDTDV